VNRPGLSLLRPFEIAGYLAVWPALYTLSAAVLLADLVGSERPTILAGTLLTTLSLSLYLIDRVKLADRAMDPGDADTHPKRHAWLWAHRSLARSLAAVAFAVATGAGFLIHPAMALAPLAGQAAVFAYSGLAPKASRSPRRVKDLPLLKNLAAAGGLTLLAAITLGHLNDPAALTPTVPGAEILLLLIFADCLLCDVGDEPGDRKHGTTTIPVLLGPRTGRLVACVLALSAAFWIWLEGERAAATWAIGLGATQVVLAGLPRELLRNATDLRLPLLALAVMLTSR